MAAQHTWAACFALLASATAFAETPPTPGNVALGQAVYEAKCSACHSITDHRVGPRHAGVLGRKAGSVAGYDYSPALASSRVVWTQATLKKWLTDPELVIPGQRMGYRLGPAQERADVVAYLATLK
jgi:cytochrome c